MKLRLALAAATCLVLPLAAHAQPVTGPYVSLEGGTSILNPTNGNIYSEGANGKILFKNSYAGAAAIGYGFGDGFRVELSGNFYRNYASKVNSYFGSFPVTGGSIRGVALDGRPSWPRRRCIRAWAWRGLKAPPRTQW